MSRWVFAAVNHGSRMVCACEVKRSKIKQRLVLKRTDLYGHPVDTVNMSFYFCIELCHFRWTVWVWVNWFIKPRPLTMCQGGL